MSNIKQKNLVIVESPTKAKTLQRYLGPEYQILPTNGHVCDLKRKENAVEPDKNFAMHYELVKRNLARINAILDAAAQADTLYLATDPDREGEAISYQVYELLQNKKLLSNNIPVNRVVFHEITKKAIAESFLHPRTLAMDLIQAQWARRALDYLVGFQLSPLLWRKIRPKLSAGRVQSPALRMIVEREEEIEQFKTQEYWTIVAQLAKQEQSLTYPFSAKLITFQNEKLQQFSVTQGDEASKIVEVLKNEAQGFLTVHEIKEKQRKRQPAPPFITSTLQQEAIKKFGFSAQRTMQIAQQLYEGIDVGSGAVGLITYMRTDSVNLAQEAVAEIRGYILNEFGEKVLPENPRVYQTRSKNAQEAHEAIRPTEIARHPDKIKHALTIEQFKLYQLIWKRTVACQMEVATFAVVTVDFICGNASAALAVFRTTGTTLEKPGFMLVYQESEEDQRATDDTTDENKKLPLLRQGEKVPLTDILGQQHFTEPPARYSEASLIKALEEFGIGRPSTYANIIATIKTREYATLEQKRFKPTDIGRIVNRFLCAHFQKYVDYDFTAKLEDALDEVSRGEKKWIPLLEEFWVPFKDQINFITETVQRKDVTQEFLDEKCPQCDNQLVIRLGKLGRFIGCTNYPECNYTKNMEGEGAKESAEPEIVPDRVCPTCQQSLVIKKGRYGKFIGCSGYPNCRYIEPLEKPKETNVSCPECKQGTLVSRKSRYGKLFYSCSTYPTCKYAVWNEPIAEACPQCHWPVLTVKTTKRRGTEKVCPQKECGYTAPI